MKKLIRRITVFIILTVFALVISGCSPWPLNIRPDIPIDINPDPSSSKIDPPEPDDSSSVIESSSVIDEPSSSVVESSDIESKFDGKQVTEEDIDAINTKKVIYIYDEEGFLTTLIGRFYDRPVKDFDDAINAINPIRSLMGLYNEIQPFAVYASKDQYGNTYYTYQQRYGTQTLFGCTLKIVVDPEGWTIAMSSSFHNVNPPENTTKITKEEALEIVKQAYSGHNVTYYPENTHELAVEKEGMHYNSWIVYTSNDNADIFEQKYIGHFVSFDGTYLLGLPMTDFQSTTENQYEAEKAFDVLEQTSVHYFLTYPNGQKYEVDIPVCYNPQAEMYVLADKSRKMMVADYADWNYKDTLTPVMSAAIDKWDAGTILEYYNFIRVYDYYLEKFNFKSPDGFDTPILITTNWVDESGTPVNNACFYGRIKGWQCFGVSTANNFCEAVDVVGHEYTHAVFFYQMQGSRYWNETGALNESYADIMGNIIEMSLGATTDTTWAVGEASGTEMRSMSKPWLHEQPAKVGDIYYMNPCGYPSGNNDNGGVHRNSSLTNYVAYRLATDGGAGLDKTAEIWVTAMELMTPYSDYDDFYACLRYAARTCGYPELEEFITEVFIETQMAGDRKETAKTYLDEGFARVNFTVPKGAANTNLKLEVYYTLGTQVGGLIGNVYPTPDGQFSFQIDASLQICMALVQYNSDGTVILYYTTDNKWSKDNTSWGIFNFQAGKVYNATDVT